QAVNESLQFTKAISDPDSSKELGSEPQTLLPPLKNLHGASPSYEVMKLTYQEHSPRERPNLGTMKHTKLETLESSKKSIPGPVTAYDLEPVSSLVPTDVANTPKGPEEF
ncbi:hypothetical protein Tco_1328078, partial [Tanacetum coccineum]